MNMHKLMAATTPEFALNLIRFAVLAVVVLLSLLLPDVAFAYPTDGGIGG